MNIDPTKEEFLAVVTGWTSTGPRGGYVGSAIPLYCTTQQVMLRDAREVFPDPGYVFLVNRGVLREWDWVLLHPQRNEKYTPGKSQYLAFETPTLVKDATSDAVVPYDTRIASVLDVNSFDPHEPKGVIRNPHQNVLPIFFTRVGKKIYGPLRRVALHRKIDVLGVIDSIEWEPYGSSNELSEFAEDQLGQYKLELRTYIHENPDDEFVARNPIHVLLGPVLTAKSDKMHDRLPQQKLIDWFVEWSKMTPIPNDVLKTLRNAPEYLKDTTPEVIRQRCRRVSQLMNQIDSLQSERLNAGNRYLETEAGQKLLQELVAKRMEERTKIIDEEIKAAKKELLRENYDLQKKGENLKQEIAQKIKAGQNEIEQLQEQKSTLQQQIELLQQQLNEGVKNLVEKLQSEWPLAAVVSSAIRPVVTTTSPNPSPSADVPVPPPAPTSKSAAPFSLPEVVAVCPTKELDVPNDEHPLIGSILQEYRALGWTVSNEFAANLYISVKTSPFTFIAGPAGYPHALANRVLASALGHLNASLEIQVASTWKDDTELLGKYDPAKDRYLMGSTGLLNRLRQAEIDWKSGKKGIYFIHFVEANLARMERYLSRLLPSFLHAGKYALNLYQRPDLQFETVNIYPNVRFIGSITTDGMGGKLPLRLADLAGIITMNPSDISLSQTAIAPSNKGISANTFVEKWNKPPQECPQDCWLQIEQLLGFLRVTTPEFGSGIHLSPVAIQNVQRYLANAVALLLSDYAVDLVFSQRVLPAVRGRGTRYLNRMKNLADRLRERNMFRSAERIRHAIEQTELTFGDLDFLSL